MSKGTILITGASSGWARRWLVSSPTSATTWRSARGVPTGSTR